MIYGIIDKRRLAWGSYAHGPPRQMPSILMHGPTEMPPLGYIPDLLSHHPHSNSCKFGPILSRGSARHKRLAHIHENCPYPQDAPGGTPFFIRSETIPALIQHN